MKNQASINISIVDDPINPSALPGSLALRATSNGIVITDADGVMKPLTGGQEYTINGKAADENGNFTITAEELDAAPSSHTHEMSEVDDLQIELNKKSDVGHTHQLVSNLQVGENTLSNNIKLVAGDNVSLETMLNQVIINVNAQAAGDAAAVQNLAANGKTVQVFVGTQSEWDSYSKQPDVNYLVYILEG